MPSDITPVDWQWVCCVCFISDEITASFRRFGHLFVDWPHKAESKSYFPPKGMLRWLHLLHLNIWLQKTEVWVFVTALCVSFVSVYFHCYYVCICAVFCLLCEAFCVLDRLRSPQEGINRKCVVITLTVAVITALNSSVTLCLYIASPAAWITLLYSV